MSEKSKNAIKLALIGIIPAVLSGLLSNCLAVMEMRAKVSSTQESTKEHADETSEAVLEGLAPAVEELQGVMIGLQEWSADTSGELMELKDKVEDLMKDSEFCKAYIQFDSRGRYKEPIKVPEIFPTRPSVPQMQKPKPAAKVPRNLSDLDSFK